MWPLPKKHFEWREPAVFRKTQATVQAQSHGWRRSRAILFLILFGLAMGAWAVARRTPNTEAPRLGVALALTAFFAIFGVYLWPWLRRFVRTSVMVFDRHIARTNGYDHLCAKFAHMASFRILDARGFRVLALEQRRGTRMYIGMPADVDVDAVSAFLEERGVPRDKTTSAPWPESMGDQSLRPDANVRPCH